MRPPECIAVLTLTALIIGGGLFPQAGVTSRYRAAMEIVRSRAAPATHAGPVSKERHELLARHPD
jgi:NADH-quinone oxidoreductase subunit M